MKNIMMLIMLISVANYSLASNKPGSKKEKSSKLRCVKVKKHHHGYGQSGRKRAAFQY